MGKLSWGLKLVRQGPEQSPDRALCYPDPCKGTALSSKASLDLRPVSPPSCELSFSRGELRSPCQVSSCVWFRLSVSMSHLHAFKALVLVPSRSHAVVFVAGPTKEETS